MIPLPVWFFDAFEHLAKQDIDALKQLWGAEPVLRAAVVRLDKDNPALHPHKYCPHCGSDHYVPNSREWEYRCLDCLKQSSPATETPFAGLHRRKYYILYAVLMTHWVNDYIEDVVWLSGCHNKIYWKEYASRLEPILAALPAPVTPFPRYLHGFTPEQQGMTCPSCHSHQVRYKDLMPAANPDLSCQVCQHHFVMHPNMPRGMLRDGTQPEVPDWFEKEFDHTSNAEYEHLVTVWHREPVLRELVDRLDEQNPDLNRVQECPYCHNHRIIQPASGSESYACPACGATFVAATGTVFYRMPKDRYWGLYRVLVLLWGQWYLTKALPICRSSSVNQFRIYEKRLQPLFEELKGRPLTPRPRWLLGFTPGEQGVRCLHCHSLNLTTEGRTVSPLDDPKIICEECGHEFMLREWFKERARSNMQQKS
ncbi:hypothetical protein [Serratia sp. DD3]|uniref:hypothetical protein n=1 Tax=Serratia sp. DD3 TaxID=1410619 RepID=UPI0003C4FB0F|nr:hypothetical protein [Serratia sp. DD3]KEY60317.1 transposase [Serratia sp. DD3]